MYRIAPILKAYIILHIGDVMKFKKSLINASVVAAALSLAACGGSSSDKTPEPTQPTNSAPTDITLSSTSVDENATGAVIGTLSATDSNASDTHSYTVNDERFVVNGAELSLAEGVVLDFETVESVDVEVTVTDSASATFKKTFTIDVNDLLDTYKFASKFTDDASSVKYTGQTARHVLIAELNHYIGNQLQADLASGELTSRQAVLDRLNKYFRTTEEQYDNFPITFNSNAAQGFLADISGSHKNLVGKIAGNDAGGQEKDWLTEFAGWGAKGSITPEGLIDVFFGQLADNAEEYLNGVAVRTASTGDEITKVYINTDGTDLKQLIQKFLLMAVPYSQAAGDYLGEDTEGKGLTTDNTGQDGTNAYSKLEHQYDEGFGYFGAARDYLAFSDEEIKANAAREDGEIDLTTEYSFGQSVNAAKRDLGTVGNSASTDYTKTTMEAFLAGRKIINDNAGSALTDEQMTSLITQRDIAVDGWERAIAATVVHYINDTRADLEQLGTEDFNYANLAKHFSEMKGFALGLQFNPYSKITDAQFEQIHTLMGDKPVLTQADVEAYRADLLTARDIIQTALSFDAENVEKW